MSLTLTKQATKILAHDLSDLLHAELCRRDFWEFCLHIDREFYTKRPFLERVARGFQRVADGLILRLHVSMPPRAGKSRTATLFCAWLLGRCPYGSIMRNTVTARLYNKFSYDTRETMLSTAYAQIFPLIALAPDKQSVDGWSTTEARQVSYFGAGVGGSIIGFGATLIAMTDDLFKGIEEGMSETVQEKTWAWYTGTHMSRQEKNCPVIDIGTRWSKKDVIGRNLEDQYYDEVISIPALDPEGKSFCEDVKSTEEYQFIKRKTSTIIFNAEYQQEPVESTGLMWSRETINRFSLKELKARMAQKDKDGHRIHQPEAKLGYIDVADEGDDALSFPRAVIFPHPEGLRIYITDWIFTTDDIDITLPLVVANLIDDPIDYVRIEANNQGSAFFKMVRNSEGIEEESILKVTSSTNKHTRILMAQGIVKHHFFFIQDDEIEVGSDYDKALDQMFDYPKAGRKKRVDSPDSIAGLAKFITTLLAHLFEHEIEAESTSEA